MGFGLIRKENSHTIMWILATGIALREGVGTETIRPRYLSEY